MLLILLLSASVILQIAAAIYALSLIPLSGRNKSWIFISVALFLMSFRRIIPLFQIIFFHSTNQFQTLSESIGFVLSAFMLTGVIGIRQYFLKHQVALNELSESENKFLEAFQHIPAAIVVSSLENGEIFDINDAFLTNLGYTREEVIGKTSTEIGIFHESTGRDILTNAVKTSPLVQAKEFMFNKKSGEVIYGLLSASTFRLKGKKCLLTTVFDITDRKKAEMERFKMLNIIEKSLNEIYIFNAKTLKFEYANQGALNNLGFSLEEIKGLTPVDIKPFYTERTFLQLIDPLLSGEKDLLVFETVHQRKNRTHYFIEVHMQLHKNENETRFLSIVNDITERKKNEEELLMAKEKAEEADQLKTAFLHNISHEIRTPMNAIIGFSGFLQDPKLPDHKRKQFTDILMQSTQQLLSIITDIINIATIEAGQEKIQQVRFNINQKFDLLIQQFFTRAKEKRIQLRYKESLSFERAFILADETKLTQILTNIINNALKFTSEGIVEFGYIIKERMIEFYVTDTGPGIPQNMYSEVFKRFRQLDLNEDKKHGGSGLGLSISKAYVELLGGTIWIESEINKGSTFYFNIPYIQANDVFELEPIAKDVVTTHLQNNLKILVAEDEDSNYILIEEILAELDFQVIRAINGIQAVEACKNDPGIKLVLMDIKMPILDGCQATKLIKTIRPELPIIAQTAYADDKERLKILDCGCDDFISKPLNTGLLMNKINKILSNT
jgi:PAS domain S-box-containing protein